MGFRTTPHRRTRRSLLLANAFETPREGASCLGRFPKTHPSIQFRDLGAQRGHFYDTPCVTEVDGEHYFKYFKTMSSIRGQFYSSCHKSSCSIEQHNATTSSADSTIHVGNSFPLSHHANDRLRVLTNMGARRPPSLQTSNPTQIRRDLWSLARYGYCNDDASRITTQECLREPLCLHAYNSSIIPLFDRRRRRSPSPPPLVATIAPRRHRRHQIATRKDHRRRPYPRRRPSPRRQTVTRKGVPRLDEDRPCIYVSSLVPSSPLGKGQHDDDSTVFRTFDVARLCLFQVLRTWGSVKRGQVLSTWSIQPLHRRSMDLRHSIHKSNTTLWTHATPRKRATLRVEKRWPHSLKTSESYFPTRKSIKVDNHRWHPRLRTSSTWASPKIVEHFGEGGLN